MCVGPIDSYKISYFFNSRVDFFSAIGGLLGLCLGLSIVTLIEIVWLCLKMGSKFLGPTNQGHDCING
jgi:hypothetical protein